MTNFVFTGPNIELQEEHPVFLGLTANYDSCARVKDIEALIDHNPEVMGLVEPPFFKHLSDFKLPEKETFLAFLLERRTPPLTTGETHGEVLSFLMDLKTFQLFIQDKTQLPANQLAYEALNDLYKVKFEVQHLLVRQTPAIPGPSDTSVDLKLRVAIAHKGLKSDLDVCLSYLHKGLKEIPESQVSVCLDEPSDPIYEELMARHNEVLFFQSNPTGAGTFALKEKLILHGESGLVFLNDSDDISTTDRFTQHLIAHHSHPKTIIGSHELRFDEIAKKILAVRYPVDVHVALKRWPGHSMLVGTESFLLEDFERIGGFSTQLKFGADTQFLFRSFFFVDLYNIDEFLYIRKRHAKALTAPESMRKTKEERLRLGQLWANDFVAIRDGKKPLEGSHLTLTKGNPVELIPLNELAKNEIH